MKIQRVLALKSVRKEYAELIKPELLGPELVQKEWLSDHEWKQILNKQQGPKEQVLDLFQNLYPKPDAMFEDLIKIFTQLHWLDMANILKRCLEEEKAPPSANATKQNEIPRNVKDVFQNMSSTELQNFIRLVLQGAPRTGFQIANLFMNDFVISPEKYQHATSKFSCDVAKNSYQFSLTGAIVKASSTGTVTETILIPASGTFHFTFNGSNPIVKLIVDDDFFIRSGTFEFGRDVSIDVSAHTGFGGVLENQIEKSVRDKSGQIVTYLENCLSQAFSLSTDKLQVFLKSN